MPILTPNQAQWLTLAFIVAVTILVVGYDMIAIHVYGVDASISRVFRHLFGHHPTLFVAMVFWLGVLVGHIGLPTE
jgi:threonine/homoserine/homoserine lactone efflux protein